MITLNPDATPRRSVPLESVRSPGGVEVLTPTGVRVQLNTTAAALFELCDGATGVDEMVRAVCELFGLRADRAEAEVSRALQQMTDAGLVS